MRDGESAEAGRRRPGRKRMPVISVGPKACLWASFFNLASPNGKLLEKQQILTWQIFYQVAKIEDLTSGI